MSAPYAHAPPDTGTAEAPDVGIACLQANLAAIGQRDPGLVQRISLPVRDDHVRVDEAGAMAYRHRGAWFPLGVAADELDRAFAAVADVDSPGADGAIADGAIADGAGAPESLFVFGVGGGELVIAAARRFPTAVITVWERDPWLLRVFLMRVDCSDVILAGRLRFALLGDLLDHAGRVPEAGLVVHPFLGRVYRHELRLLREGAGPRRVFVCAGELFVDDLSAALTAEGWQPLTLDTGLLAVEEMAYFVQRVRPRLLATVNYKGGLAEFARALGVPLVCWEIDPTTDRVEPLDGPVEGAHVFTYRAAQVDEFRRAGFPNVTYLPLAANPERRRPLELSDAERAGYGAGVVFVGTSMVAPAARYRARFVEIVAAGEDGDLAEARAAVERRLDAVLAEQARDFSQWRIPALLAEAFPDLGADWVAARASEAPEMLVGEIAAAQKRRAWVTALAPLGVDVWGDDGWADLDGGARYRGSAGHLVELTKVYCGATINVDIGRLYQSDIVPMRVFDVLACGAFVLAEHSPALDDLFTVGHDVETYRTGEELVDKVRWYLAHPDQAAAIALRGMERVRAEHTIRARVTSMLEAAGLA